MLNARLARIVFALSCAFALAAALAGCDACGNWPWDEKPKSCHSEEAH
jgi:hypothetical protein